MATKTAAVVKGKDGLVGTIESSGGASAVIRLEDGRRVVVSADLLLLQGDGSYALNLSSAEIGSLVTAEAAGEIIVPVVAEEISIGKRSVETGRVRIHKTVRTTEQVVDEPLMREDVEVERVPIGRVIGSPVESRQEGDTLIIPILEEVLVIEKRLMLKEELRITRRKVEHRSAQTISLRSEEATIQRTDLDDPVGDVGGIKKS